MGGHLGAPVSNGGTHSPTHLSIFHPQIHPSTQPPTHPYHLPFLTFKKMVTLPREAFVCYKKVIIIMIIIIK